MHISHATQFGSALHAVLICGAHEPGPPSAATCAGPSRQVRQAWVGATCGVAQMFARHSLPQGPGAAVVPHPHERSAFTKVTYPMLAICVGSMGG